MFKNRSSKLFINIIFFTLLQDLFYPIFPSHFLRVSARVFRGRSGPLLRGHASFPEHLRPDPSHGQAHLLATVVPRLGAPAAGSPPTLTSVLLPHPIRPSIRPSRDDNNETEEGLWGTAAERPPSCLSCSHPAGVFSCPPSSCAGADAQAEGGISLLPFPPSASRPGTTSPRVASPCGSRAAQSWLAARPFFRIAT